METIPYSQFKQHIAAGKLVKLVIGPEHINGTLAGNTGQAFTTLRVDDLGLVKALGEQNVSYAGQYENKFLSGILSWVIPFGIFFLIWRFAIEKMGPGEELRKMLSSATPGKAA